MRIAIIGCGVGGMGAAIALTRDGHDITLFDRFEAPSAVGAGLLLQPSGLEALAALGLREQVEARGARVTALVGNTPAGKRVLDLSYQRWAPNCHGLGVHRATLFNTLYDATRDAGVVARCGTEIVRIDTPHRPVLIDSEQNSHGPFDLAIVANGAASGLRDQLLPKARAPLYPWGAIWTIRPDPDGRWDSILAQVYGGARVMIGVLPVGMAPDVPGKHVALFWSLREDKYASWRDAGIESWRADMKSYWPQAARLLDGFSDFASLPYARYRDVQAWPWSLGSTLLLGDAAHATSPQLGQGANLALADAVALAAALKSNAVAPALAEYRRVRAAPVAWVQFMSAALTPVFQSRSRLIGWARDLLLGPVSRCWPFSWLMLATLTGSARLPLAMLLSSVAKFLVRNRRV
jgi:2-polyprenyl-6-methoxyphenol hydroxylase-like FAD-dependent oxidoreductase